MTDLKTQLGVSDDESEPEYLQYKIILLGDGAVGKTSLAMRFCEDHFAKAYKQTIGLDFFVKRVVLPGDVHVCMQIWDIGGQSIGGKMLANYIYGSQAVVLCYDVTNHQSFQDLEDWFRLVTRAFDKVPMPYIALMANKSDLVHLRSVKVEKHNSFAEENDLYSYFVSAKTGDQVEPSFFRIAADLAGVTLSKPDLEVTQKAVKAEIVNHQRNDPQHPEVNADELGKSKKCTIM